MAYDHLEIEARWQRYWDEHGRACRGRGGRQRDITTEAQGVGFAGASPRRRVSAEASRA
jgi:hypothetical protein